MEYSRLGNVIKGQERAVAKSKYEENVRINNHSVSWHVIVEQWSYSYTGFPVEGTNPLTFFDTASYGKRGRE